MPNGFNMSEPDHFAHAQQHLKDGDPLGAAQLLRHIKNPMAIEGYSAFRIALDKACDDYSFKKAKVHLANGEPEEALNALHKIWNRARFEELEKLCRAASRILPIKNQLGRLDSPTCTPSKAGTLIREALVLPGMIEPIYQAFENVTWTLLQVGAPNQKEFVQWHDLVMGTRAYLLDKNCDEMVDKLDALGRLIQSASQLKTEEQIRDHAFIPSILREIEVKGGYALYDELASKHVSTSCVFASFMFKMAATGLLDREEIGRVARFRLTELGRQRLNASAESLPN